MLLHRNAPALGCGRLATGRIAVLAVGLLASTTVGAERTNNILLTGYWPPTDEMLVQFSDDPALNPGGWQGRNWEGSGYDVYAFFPSYPDGDGFGTQGVGDLEVDYQDTSEDFWRITEQLHPVAIMGYGRNGGQGWELENRAVNRDGWTNDYSYPRQPVPSPPEPNPAVPGSDPRVPVDFVRYSTLPIEDIRDAINRAGIEVHAWIDYYEGPGGFLCNYMAYHVSWYQSIHCSPDDPYQCLVAGFTHVTDLSPAVAKAAAEIALRATIHYLGSPDSFALHIGAIGDGMVGAAPNDTYPHFQPGTEVTLTAVPHLGETFLGWTGGATGTENPLLVTVDTNMQIAALFSDTPIATAVGLGLLGMDRGASVELTTWGDVKARLSPD